MFAISAQRLLTCNHRINSFYQPFSILSTVMEIIILPQFLMLASFCKISQWREQQNSNLEASLDDSNYWEAAKVFLELWSS